VSDRIRTGDRLDYKQTERVTLGLDSALSGTVEASELRERPLATA
jgi:hypothetical protein